MKNNESLDWGVRAEAACWIQRLTSFGMLFDDYDIFTVDQEMKRLQK
jgi:hypothetical protein